MSEKNILNLDGVAETLLATLYIRAMESQRPDALIKDDKAVALVNQMSSAFNRIRQIKMDDDDKVSIILRNLEFDRAVRVFLADHPTSSVVHIGCGLDLRFERVDNGQVEWYDLDLPEVIDVRRKLFGDETTRHHMLAYSAFDSGWLEKVSNQSQPQKSFLFIAEGVLMYFAEAQVKSLVMMLQEHFPGSEFIFDAFSPFIVRMNNLRMSLTKMEARYHWGLKHGKDLERWNNGIQLLDEWFPFDHPQPRLAHIQWMRHIPFLARVLGIYHYRLLEVI
jgi:methyltransferase (TIGR00027 family)